ncbi:MAG: hypothetical protein QQW96_14730 [Tychonema bourrellyi B0820]|nr:hypothetical protein [Tychonema bourrellyi B0820]
MTIEAKKYQSRPVPSNPLPVMSPENTLHDLSTDVDSLSTSATDSQFPEHHPESPQPELQAEDAQTDSQSESQPEIQSDSQSEPETDSPQIQAEKVGKPTPKPIKKSDLAHQSKPQQDAPQAKIEGESKPTPKPIKKGDLPPPPASEPQSEAPTEQAVPAEIPSTPKAKKIIGEVAKSQSQRSPSRDGAESGGGFNMATQRPPKAPKSQS